MVLINIDKQEFVFQVRTDLRTGNLHFLLRF